MVEIAIEFGYHITNPIPLALTHWNPNMKTLIAALLCVFLVDVAASSNPEKFSQVRIFATSESDFRRITDAGLFIDHANTKPGYYSDAWLSETEMGMLKKSGVPYQILVDDWDSYYSSLPKMTQTERDAAIRQSAELYNVSHSIYGTMGGYMTYAEVVSKLDSMRTEYPNFISAKFSIGTTLQGRALWAVRITKNPDAPTGRPEVLYHALIHAREPESMETQFYYFYWLFENYGVDPLATYILENREIYWIPVFNADGYVYNQTHNPTGGGMWRCNVHNNGAGCGHVDLNRNFGIYQFWNSPNGGSSTDSCSGGQGTYRGRNPFSELETQNIMNFVNSRNFNASFGAHTYGNYLIKPWAWSDPSPTPDDAKFNLYLSDMKASNPVYTTGTPSQTVGYMVRGGSDDWYYNDSAHVGHHIFAITPETGNDFWPAQSEIIPLAEGMLYNNQYMSLIGGPFVNPLSTTFNQPTYTQGQSGTYKVVFRNKGALAANNVSVSWTSTNSGITIPNTLFTYPSLASFAADSSLFSFTISPLIQSNSAIPTQLTVKIDTTTIYSVAAYVFVGTPVIVVLNDSATSFSNWTRSPGGTWNTTTAQFHTPPSSFTDSPGGNYSNNIDNSMILASPIDASTTPGLILSFYHKYTTEAGYDYCRVEVSSDNGTTWRLVRDYNGTLATWTQQSFDISSYANGSSQTKIRFRLISDPGVTADGWYVDDILVRGYSIAQTPDTGIITRPNSFTFAGVTGRVFRDSIRIANNTLAPVQIAVAESTTTIAVDIGAKQTPAPIDFQALIRRLRPAFEKAHLTRDSFLKAPTETLSDNPDTYTTIITDQRNENDFGAADVYRVDHQVHTFLSNTYHDFRIVLGNLPDTNVVGFISIDTDQDFGTGPFPTPFGVGLTSRDLGSEREALFDASGILIDSLTHIGRIPAGVVINSATDSLIGIPFLLSVTRDSVLTISTTNALGLGIRQDWLGDADGNYNVGVTASRLKQGSNPISDFAPEIGHGIVGAETGTSWLSENVGALTVQAGDSAVVRVTGVAARVPGIYNTFLKLASAGRPDVNIPVQLNVTGLAQPHIVLNSAGYYDTLRVGDSTMHTLTISNTGNADLIWGLADTSNTAWLSASPSFGTTVAGQPSSAIIKLVSEGLTPNTTYTSQYLVLSNDHATGTIILPISLRVTPFTGVDDNGASIPKTFALRQNYPNPFNPETNISFDLPKGAFVSLKVFNIIGQEVATIVNRQLPAGTHSYMVGGERFGLTSGVYFYRLTAGEFVQTRKMVVLR